MINYGKIADRRLLTNKYGIFQGETSIELTVFSAIKKNAVLHMRSYLGWQ